MRLQLLVVLSFVSVLGSPARGSAQTTQGVLPGNETWTGAITIIGDVTVPTGVTLTIAPGAVISFAGTDSMGSGADTSRPELIVEGTLNASGTAGQPVELKKQSSNTWYGVRLLAGSSAAFDHVTLGGARYGIYGQATFTFKNGTVSGNSEYGIYVNGGSPEISNSLLLSNASRALMVYSGSNVNVHHNEVRSNCSSSSTYAVYLRGATVAFDHNTIAHNPSCSYGLYLYSTGTFTVTNNVVAQNGSYGVYSYSSSRTIQNNLVWGHSTNTYNTTSVSGVTYNPLFVSSTNLRITHRSPARKADSSGTDLGALPYTSDQTPSLEGKIFDNLTLPSGTHQVPGDLIVAPSVTLTLSPGATLSFAPTDEMGGGSDTGQPELIVEGTLSASGTAAQPVKLDKQSSSTWYGVRLLAGSSATFDHVTLSGARYGIYGQASFTFKNGTVSGNTEYGIYVNGGSPEIAYNVFLSNTSRALMVYSGSNVNVHHNEVRGNCTSSSTYAVYLRGATVAFDHNTIAHNPSCSYGLYLYSTGTFTVTNNVVAQNGSYGVYSYSSSRTIQNNLVWGHSTNTYHTTSQNGVSANPLFVSPPSDLHLQAASPARNKATDGSDLGCYPYQTGPVDHVVVSPQSANVVAKGTYTFTATAYDASNNPIPGATISWSASAGGTITQAGIFTAGCTAGTFTDAVTAAVGAISDSASVTVTAGPAVAITVSPAAPSVQVKGTQAFTAQGEDACGNSVGLGGAVSWSVSATTIGSIDASGSFTAGCSTGTHQDAIVAQSGALTGKADVTITAGALETLTISPQNPTIPTAGTQAFTVSGADTCGTSVATGTVAWSVVAGGGTIDASGVFTAGSQAGTFVDTVQAQAGSVSTKTSVTIVAGQAASVIVNPNPGKVAVGQSASFSAVAYDSASNPVPNVTITWSATGGGTIDQSGTFTAGTTAGTFTDAIVATAAGVSGKATVEVSPASAATVVVNPATITIAPGGTSSFSAEVKDGFGNKLSDPVTWAVTDPSAGTIDQSGVFTAGTVLGTYPDVVTATAGSVVGKATVVVKAGALHHLTITPTLATLKPTATVAFSVKGYDDQNNEVSVSPAWAVVNGGGTITNQGIFATGTKAGTYQDTVQVNAGGLSTTATVMVEPGALNAIHLTPTHATLKADETQQFNAKGADAWGNSVVLDDLTWSADPSAGTVNQSGLFTSGKTAGDWPAGVTASMDSISANAGIRIESGNLTPPDPTGEDGGCGCVVGRPGGRGFPALLLLLALVAFLRRRGPV